MNIKRHINFIVGFLFLAAAVALWAMPPNAATPTRADALSRVELAQVQAGNQREGARFAGVTQAKNRAVLSFSVPARVIERPVTTGSKVTRGTVLARLDDGEYRNAANLAEAAVAELKTQWEQACRDRRRIQKLTESRVATVSDLEKVTTREKSLEASLQAATSKLKEARRLLHETVLKAPFSGTVTSLYIQAGEWAGPGQPAIELTDRRPTRGGDAALCRQPHHCRAHQHRCQGGHGGRPPVPGQGGPGRRARPARWIDRPIAGETGHAGHPDRAPGRGGQPGRQPAIYFHL
jgi:multidrug efflux pump subunit AcrA (membrane-fusion protein)